MGNNHSRPRRGGRHGEINRNAISRPISGSWPGPSHPLPALATLDHANSNASHVPDGVQTQHMLERSVPTAEDFLQRVLTEDSWGRQLENRAQRAGGLASTPPPYEPAPQPSRRNRLSRVFDEHLSFHSATPRPRGQDSDPQPRRRNRVSRLFHDLNDRYNHRLETDTGEATSPPPQLDIDNGTRFDLSIASASGAYQPPAGTQPQQQESDNATRQTNGTFTDRTSLLTPHREFSRLRAASRRNRARRNGQDTSMANILTLAASALAATLTGTNSQVAAEDLRRATSGVGRDDSNLETFMQFLSSGRLSNHLARSMAAADDPNSATDTPPLDFFRMFQLGNATLRPPGIPLETVEEHEEGRMVPVLIVGIRSLMHDGAGAANGAAANPQETDPAMGVPDFVDHLARARSSEATPAMSRPTSTYSPSGVTVGEPRRQTWHSENGIPRLTEADLGMPAPGSPHSTGTSPPHNTPESPISSPPDLNATQGVNSANGVTGVHGGNGAIGVNSSNAVNGVISPSIPEGNAATDGRESRSSRRSSRLGRSDRSPSPARRRGSRRSGGMDFLRHGSGSARRRGIIGPDRPPAEGNRSWIIYVLGGNYPENHPILMAPSLFTDTPTYEDMLMLSSLIGPAKPPVATAEDIAAAGGLFVVRIQDGVAQAVAIDDGIGPLPLENIQNCGICLEAYAEDEMVRQLPTCQHLYHRDCVDQVIALANSDVVRN